MLDSADHFRTTREQRHYTEPQLDRSSVYRGPLEKCTDEEGRALLEQCSQFFNLTHMPLPPYGLPGTSARPSEDDPEYELLELGFRYLRALARGEARTLHNLWADAGNLINRIEAAERKRCDDAAHEQWIAERKAENPNWPFTPAAEDKRLVYFIAADDGPIKIGIAGKVQSRLRSLQTGHHAKLSVLATTKGGQEQERAYHAQFAAHRLNGEWFERHPDILNEIERLRSEAV